MSYGGRKSLLTSISNTLSKKVRWRLTSRFYHSREIEVLLLDNNPESLAYLADLEATAPSNSIERYEELHAAL
jgi:hypothetical protein